MPARHLIAAICLPLLGLAGCAQPQAASSAVASKFAADYAGKASNCTAAPVEITAGHDIVASMTTGGGGWCAINVTAAGKPLAAALLTQPPHGGSVYVHTVGEVTRVDYTPRSGAAADSFTLKFIPGDQTMRVTVNSPAQAAK